MALSGTGKIMAGATCAGITGCAGIGTYLHLNNSKEVTGTSTIEPVTAENISQKLGKIGYQVLKTEGADDDAQWDAILIAYNKIQQKGEIFSISTVGKIETRDNLKSECKKAIDSDSSENTNYSLAKRWCVKPESINEMLKRNRHTKLDNNNAGINKKKWKEKISLIKDKAEEMQSMGLVFQDNDDNNVALLEATCEKLKIDSTKTHDDKEFEKHYTQAKNWCSLEDS
ncbi:hypothetical protein A6V39_00820 [Candidatus Mycoplasma haematobovis]|uniref:Uncharacterized protein n=1 Tax=Candidatus Mycoplasma haematobovis TaxID=432608 RepID=A0A1A9QEN5_9MOLU|nr:hypothetical protein [Candidatus Mycoplasma haematobovis]OAL10594.1 hypothetical protein A6V39_00820 [Candidatus Mycoplasma haematobovis]